MRCFRTLGLSRYGFEFFNTPIKPGRFGDVRLAHKGIVRSRRERRQAFPRLVLDGRLTMAGSLCVNFTRDA